MSLLPQFHQIAEVRIRHIQYVTHLIPFRIPGPDDVIPVSQSHAPILAQFKNGNYPLISAMNMRRIMILWIHAECDPIELVRAHNVGYSQIKR